MSDRQGLEPSNYEFRATTRPKVPPRPARYFKCFITVRLLNLNWRHYGLIAKLKQLVHFNIASQSCSVSVYYVAVRTNVLSRHGSNLARPVIIHDIIHSLMCMPSTPHRGFSGVSPDGNCAYVHRGSFTSNSKSVRRAIWFTWFSEPHDTTSLYDVPVYTAPGSPRRLPSQLWTGRHVA